MRMIYLFRHGETDWNREMRFQGHLDVPLNDQGRLQALGLIRPLAAAKIEAILSSDLSRARETAQIIAGRIGVPVFEDARLREAHLGEAQGLTPDEMRAKFGHELVDRWRSHHLSDADVNYPGGETGRIVRERVLAAIEDFITTQPYRRVAISTHGGVIRRILQHVLGLEQVPIPNCVLYSLKRQQGENASWALEQTLKIEGAEDEEVI